MKEIFEILEKDARTTAQQISTMIGVPIAEVEKVIKKAEKERSEIDRMKSDAFLTAFFTCLFKDSSKSGGCTASNGWTTAKAPAEEIKSQARSSGMITLEEDGIQKVRDGLTTVEEVLRVTQEE